MKNKKYTLEVLKDFQNTIQKTTKASSADKLQALYEAGTQCPQMDLDQLIAMKDFSRGLMFIQSGQLESGGYKHRACLDFTIKGKRQRHDLFIVYSTEAKPRQLTDDMVFLPLLRTGPLKEALERGSFNIQEQHYFSSKIGTATLAAANNELRTKIYTIDKLVTKAYSRYLKTIEPALAQKLQPKRSRSYAITPYLIKQSSDALGFSAGIKKFMLPKLATKSQLDPFAYRLTDIISYMTIEQTAHLSSYGSYMDKNITFGRANLGNTHWKELAQMIMDVIEARPETLPANQVLGTFVDAMNYGVQVVEVEHQEITCAECQSLDGTGEFKDFYRFITYQPTELTEGQLTNSRNIIASLDSELEADSEVDQLALEAALEAEFGEDKADDEPLPLSALARNIQGLGPEAPHYRSSSSSNKAPEFDTDPHDQYPFAGCYDDEDLDADEDLFKDFGSYVVNQTSEPTAVAEECDSESELTTLLQEFLEGKLAGEELEAEQVQALNKFLSELCGESFLVLKNPLNLGPFDLLRHDKAVILSADFVMSRRKGRPKGSTKPQANQAAKKEQQTSLTGVDQDVTAQALAAVANPLGLSAQELMAVDSNVYIGQDGQLRRKPGRPRKHIAPKEPGKRGRPKGSKNKNTSPEATAQAAIKASKAQANKLLKINKIKRKRGRPPKHSTSLKLALKPTKTEETLSGIKKLKTARRIAYLDLTSFRLQSKSVKPVEVGKESGTEHIGRQVKIAVAIDHDTQIPCYAAVFRGNTADCTVIDQAINTLQEAGYQEVILVMDRGFDTAENKLYLDQKGVKFVMMSNMTNAESALIAPALQELRQINLSRYIPSLNRFGTVTKTNYYQAGYTEDTSRTNDLFFVSMLEYKDVEEDISKRVQSLILRAMQYSVGAGVPTDEEVQVGLFILEDGVWKLNMTLVDKLYDVKTYDLVTNIKFSDNPMETIGDCTRYSHAIDNIYSLRWNSELFFKAMKSGLGLRALFVKNDYSLGFKLGCMLMSVSISRHLQRCVNSYMVTKQKVKSYLNSFRGQLAKVGNLLVKTDYADSWTLHSVSSADHERFTEMWQVPYPNETTLRDSCEVLSAGS